MCVCITIAKAGVEVGEGRGVYIRLGIVRVGWVCHAGAVVRRMRARRMVLRVGVAVCQRAQFVVRGSGEERPLVELHVNCASRACPRNL